MCKNKRYKMENHIWNWIFVVFYFKLYKYNGRERYGKWQTDRLESADTYRIFDENFVKRVHHDIPLTFVKDLNAL